MKKFLSFLFLVLLAFFMVGCGETTDTPAGEDVQAKANEFLGQITVTASEGETLQTVTKNVTLGKIENTEVTVTWASDNAAISNTGAVTQAEEDVNVKLTVTVKYKDATVTKDFNVTVKGTGKVNPPEPVQVTSVTLAGEQTLLVGATATLTATVLPADAENKEVTWSTSDATIVTVDNGTITAVAAGKATITATSKQNTEIKGTLEITVNAPETPVSTIADALKLKAQDVAKVQGTVVGRYAQGFMIYDGTGFILVFQGNVEIAQKIGDYVQVEGAIAVYKKNNQFDATCTITPLTTGTDYTFEATSLDLEALKTYMSAVEYGKLVKVEFTVTSASANYVNALVGDSTDKGVCVAYPVADFTYEVGKTYIATGYSLYSSTYNNVQSLYIMVNTVEEKIIEKFSVTLSTGEVQTKDTLAINKFDYASVYDADQSSYVWLVTKEQINAESASGFALYERIGLKLVNGKYVVVGKLASDGKVSSKDSGFDYILMVSKKSTNLEKFNAIEINDVITFSEDITTLESGDVYLEATIGTFKGETTEYIKEAGKVTLETRTLAEHVFTGWMNLYTGEIVTETDETVVVMPTFRRNVFYVDAINEGDGIYATVDAALEVAQAGDTIILTAGTYANDFTIDKAITLTSTIKGNPTIDDTDYKDETKAAVITGKIYVTGKNIKITNLTITSTGRVGFFGGANDGLDNFVFDSNYVYDTTDQGIAWKDGSYGVGSKTAAGIWSKYPGVVSLSGWYAWVTNASFTNNKFENILGTGIYDCVGRGLTVDKNVFINVSIDAVRSDYSSAYDTFNYTNNRFENIGNLGIYQRCYGANALATVNVIGNMFKECGKLNSTSTKTRSGAFSTGGHNEKADVVLNIKYNVFENNQNNLSIRSNVTTAATYAKVFTLDVSYNAFITSSNAVIQKALYGSDTTATNFAIGTFNNNFYGVDYVTKFDITEANFEHIIKMDEVTYNSVKELEAALPEGVRLPDYQATQYLTLTAEEASLIANNPTALIVKAGLQEGYIYIYNDNRYVFGERIFATIDDAIAKAKEQDVIAILAGEYEKATVKVSGLTFLGVQSYAFAHTDSYEVTAADTKVAGFDIAGVDGITIKNIVISASIAVSDAKNANFESIYSVSGWIAFNGNNENVVVKDFFFAGANTRAVYVQTGLTKNITIDGLIIMDAALCVLDANGAYADGVCDGIRFGMSNTATVDGAVIIKNCYIRAGQCGFQDRLPNADSYTITNNYIIGAEDAIYLRKATITKTMAVTIEDNIFVECGNSIKDWDVVYVASGDNVTINIHKNSFVNSFKYAGTVKNYLIIMPTAAGTIDCANNYCNIDSQKTMVNNATNLSWITFDTYYLATKDYPMYKVVTIYSTLCVVGENVLTEEQYAALNRGTKEAPIDVYEATKIINGMTYKAIEEINKGYVKGKVTELSYNDKYKSYTLTIVDLNGATTKTIKVYSATLAESVTSINVGDEIVAYGYFENYNGTLEIAGDATHDYPVIEAVTHPTYAISVAEDSSTNASVVELSATTSENGSSVTFKVTPADGYKVKKVTVNGIEVAAVEGLYTITVSGNMSIKVETADANEQETIKVSYSVQTMVDALNPRLTKTAVVVSELNAGDGLFVFKASSDKTGNTGKMYGTVTGGYLASGANWRFYRADGAKLTINVATGKKITIVGVKITYAVGNSGYFSLGGKELASATWGVCEGTSIELLACGPEGKTNGNVNVSNIEVEYVENK